VSDIRLGPAYGEASKRLAPLQATVRKKYTRGATADFVAYYRVSTDRQGMSGLGLVLESLLDAGIPSRRLILPIRSPKYSACALGGGEHRERTNESYSPPPGC
jgi:hypothetical protein